MKRSHIFPLIMAILLPVGCLSGCSMGEVEQTNESLTVAYYGTDFGEYSGDIFNMAVSRYKEAYPDVELIIEREPYASTDEAEEAYFTQLAAEVMSGKGPDLFWIDPYYIDPYKMMDAGAFADLTPFVDSDPDFSGDAYNMEVVNGIRYKEHLYVMPLGYDIPVFVGEKKMLEQAGFDYENCTDFMSLWEELSAYAKRCAEDPSLPQPVRRFDNITDLVACNGIPWIDYENQQIDLTAEEWPQIFEGYQSIWNVTEPGSADIYYHTLVTPVWMTDGDFLFEYYNAGTYISLMGLARGLASLGEPCLVPAYDMQGTIQAAIGKSVGIRRTSPNQQNAYNFIKILLDPELQAANGSFAPHNIPLSNEAFEQTLKVCEQEMTGKWEITDAAGTVPELGAVPPEFTQAFFDATRKVSGSYFMTSAQRELRDAVRACTEGGKSSEEAFKEAEDKLKIYISE